MQVGDKVLVEGKETEITATAFDDLGTKVYMVKGSIKDHYEEELKPTYVAYKEFKNLEEIISLCTKELYIGDRNIHATLGFTELKELQNLLNKRSALERHTGMLVNQNREQEKMIELMAFELATEDENYLYRSIDDIIECFKKKAKGD